MDDGPELPAPPASAQIEAFHVCQVKVNVVKQPCWLKLTQCIMGEMHVEKSLH